MGSSEHDTAIITRGVLNGLDEYQIEKQNLFSITTDIYSVMYKTAYLLEIEWFPCFAHLFQLPFQKIVELCPH